MMVEMELELVPVMALPFGATVPANRGAAAVAPAHNDIAATVAPAPIVPVPVAVAPAAVVASGLPAVAASALAALGAAAPRPLPRFRCSRHPDNDEEREVGYSRARQGKDANRNQVPRWLPRAKTAYQNTANLRRARNKRKRVEKDVGSPRVVVGLSIAE
jgi:hypothetical protein